MRSAIPLLLCACTQIKSQVDNKPPSVAQPLFTVSDNALTEPVTFIAYGDMRFTAATEVTASWPAVRQALVARIAVEKPAAVFISGDLPWHGGDAADYAVFGAETTQWRQMHLRVYPALGNHEFSQCEETQCLENWWKAFPDLRGHRWYSVALGSRIRAIGLDSDSSLLAGSLQRVWLEEQIDSLPSSVRYVMVWLHHPPVADVNVGKLADHNPRPNEVALANYLAKVAPANRARFIVIAGHVHNYERFEQDTVVYVVSGGGGARPHETQRNVQDRYRAVADPNFNYVRFRLEPRRLVGEMVRVEDPTRAAPEQFEVRDRFEIEAK